MKKILLVLFIITLSLSLSVISFGAEGEVEKVSGTEGVISEGDTLNQIEVDEGVTEENIFTTLYNWVVLNVGEIFSLLTLITSALLAFTYKKGLLPKLGGALGKISSLVGSISKNTDEALSSLGEGYNKITDTLSGVSSLCEGLCDEISTLSARLDESADTKGELEKMKIILASQVDMLYDIFLSSALPQFAKEAVAERVSAMRRALEGGATDNE